MFVIRRRTRIEISAPAKLNLFLEVLGRRDDGYHEIETLMVPINLFDSLVMSPRDDDGVHVTARWSPGYSSSSLGDLPSSEDNLVTHALNRLRERSGASCGADVWLEKRIPSAAGLGGGSSDAAAALLAANLLWELGWQTDQLAEVAAELGSDIPFFLFGETAVCRGRGERIEPVANRHRQFFVIVRPPAGLSTPQVYSQTAIPDQPRRVTSIIDRLDDSASSRTDVSDGMFNRLQAAATNLSPQVEQMAEHFERADVLGHQLSGSGSCYFGVCRDAQHLRRTASMLQSRNLGEVFIARSIYGNGQANCGVSQN